MKFAFCDPPYIGQARKHYGCPEVNHPALIERLVADYPDGWVLCLSSPTLREILNLCPDDVRVGAWVKPFASFKPNVNPAYAWEPVIWRGGRKRDRTEPTIRDWVSANITLKKGLSGAKPPAFCDWVFDLLGATDEDELDDLFPGTGVVSARWKSRQQELRFVADAQRQQASSKKAERADAVQHEHETLHAAVTARRMTERPIERLERQHRDIFPCPKPPKSERSPRSPRKRMRSRNAKRKGSSFPKRRNYKFQAFVREFGRCILERDPRHVCNSPVRCCHIVNQARGGYDLGNIFGGCDRAHDAQHHAGSIEAFNELWRVNCQAEADALTYAFVVEQGGISAPQGAKT